MAQRLSLLHITLKLYYLVQIMLAKTDEEHSLTMPQIIQELGKYDITAERKSIYLDFDDMTDKLGIEIVKEQKVAGKQKRSFLTKRNRMLLQNRQKMNWTV